MKGFIEVHIGKNKYALNISTIECFTDNAVYMIDAPDTPWRINEAYDELRKKIEECD